MYRPYKEDDWVALCLVAKNYFDEIEQEDYGTLIDYEFEEELRHCTKVEAKLNKYLHVDGAKIMIAEADDKIVGFMVYHLIWDCVLIVLGLYFIPEYQKTMRLRSLICSPSRKIKRVISQTYPRDRGPKNLKGEKSSRRKLGEYDGMEIWENDVIHPR